MQSLSRHINWPLPVMNIKAYLFTNQPTDFQTPVYLHYSINLEIDTKPIQSVHHEFIETKFSSPPKFN